MEDNRQETASGSTLKRRTFLGVAAGLLGAATVTVAGIKNRWWRPTPTLSIAVKGPFSDDQVVSLKEYSTSFMEPRSIQVISAGPSRAIVVLGFLFKGEQTPSRTIDVDISLRDPAGKIIGTQRLVCKDARIGAEKPTLTGSTYTAMSAENSDSASIALTAQSKIGSVDILFRPT